jgi:ERCC4-type nuclease
MTAFTPFVVLCDTREQTPPPFPEGVVLERATLDAADYTSETCQGVGVVERKSASDFAASLSHERERFEDELRRLQGYRWKVVVVESDITTIYRTSAIHPHSVLGSVASLTARWDCPVLFAGNAPGCGRLIAGLLSRWAKRIEAERGAAA